MVFIGIFEGHFDPAVAIVRNGKVLAYAEEERHLRYKHAYGIYPSNALKYCLDVAGVSLEEIKAVGINWNLPAFTDGTMKEFFESMRQEWPVDAKTIGWQNSLLRKFQIDSLRTYHEFHWRQIFGDIKFPPLHPIPHHYVHAFQACMQSPFEKSVCLTIDGSGDQHCTVIWLHDGQSLKPIREILMPHSLGWMYAAFTEYLGFRAYNGEYKVMGLAAYGSPNEDLQAKLDQIVAPAADNIEYRLDPTYIHYGSHSYSNRFTDKLIDLFNSKPRLPHEKISQWHQDLAFAVQKKLEDCVERLVLWAVRETGLSQVCIGGGVGLNIKMNSRLFQLPEVEDIFANPLCHDAGSAVGSALAAYYELSEARPERLETLALGHEESNEAIEQALKIACLHYEKPDNICEATAEELAKGRIVGWFQGRMEAGPRSLGQRSILADPRSLENRDQVNGIIKFREYWRPFCPSMTAEAASKYFENYTNAPFMVIAFPANELLKKDAPAIVHVDGTSRVQMVKRETLPLYHQLLKAFERRTGVPVLLNTSFNIKGEPIVCTIQDALRTFWSTGLEVLAAGDFLIRKTEVKN
ncbi:MAG TPA: nodulation protein [Cyanothece sp. UBA12306]|nr:nodulation protein [Cyanothece sp. UBA12306]